MKLPKLHVRDLFWLVLVCGLACAWCVRESHHKARFEHYAKSRDAESAELAAETAKAAKGRQTNNLAVQANLRAHLEVINAFVEAIEKEGYEWNLRDGQKEIPLCTTNGDISTIFVSPFSTNTLRVELLRQQN